MTAVPVYQRPGTFACLGCVAAMITGTGLDAVAAHVGHDGERRPFLMTEIAGYLAARGFLLGAYAARPKVWKRRMRARWPRSFDALLIVARSCGKGTHAVYWTGGQVIDPEPENAGKDLQQYKVLEWWPVIKVEA